MLSQTRESSKQRRHHRYHHQYSKYNIKKKSNMNIRQQCKSIKDTYDSELPLTRNGFPLKLALSYHQLHVHSTRPNHWYSLHSYESNSAPSSVPSAGEMEQFTDLGIRSFIAAEVVYGLRTASGLVKVAFAPVESPLCPPSKKNEKGVTRQSILNFWPILPARAFALVFKFL